MIRVFIIVLGIIMMRITASAGDWGSFAFFLVITLVLLGMGSMERKESIAELNWVDYWANGRKPGQRGRAWHDDGRSTANLIADIQADTRRYIEREERKAARRAAREARVSTPEVNNVEATQTAGAANRPDMVICAARAYEKIYVCPSCGRQVYSTEHIKWIAGRKYSEIYCQYCRKMRQILMGSVTKNRGIA